MRFLPFDEARTIARSLRLNSFKDWRQYCKSGNKRDEVPSSPELVYKEKGWRGWGDWLGTHRKPPFKGEYVVFQKARRYVQSLNLKSQTQWNVYCKSGKKPKNIPSSPSRTYREDWKSWGDWLGSNRIANQNKEYYSFVEARKLVQSLGLKSRYEWRRYVKSGSKPEKIPSDPSRPYKKDWKGFGDWLGTDAVAVFKRQFKSFEDARKFARSLNLKSQTQWADYCKLNKLPADIPTTPSRTYKSKWKGWGDWLGTGRVALQDMEYRNFPEARKFVRSLGLKGKEQWEEYCKSGQKPVDIPYNVPLAYKNEWTWWADWLGYEGKWNIKKIKEILRDLIKSKILYQWDEAVLYSFLLRKGLLSLHSRHTDFFTNLIAVSRIKEGRRMIEEYANSDTEQPPDLSVVTNVTNKVPDSMQEIQTISTSELPNVVGLNDPLEYQSDLTIEQILLHTDTLESTNVDEEAMQFYVDYSVDELWRCAFKNEHEAVEKIKLAGKNGNKYHDIVVDTFLADYQGIYELNIPPSYSFPYVPTLMQRYVAYKVTKLPYFGNFSGTGAGKTLSAILASRLIDCKMTIIVCPNDVVEQWKRNILDTFPNSMIVTGKEAFNIKHSSDEYRYAILNYDKFSQEESPNLILNLTKQKIEFVILDEVHFTKIRNEEEVSQRRKNLEGLMTGIRRINPSVKVLGLSATPVVNNLREGRSLLELISGKMYEDVAIRPTIPNAVTLYEKLSAISIRELPAYSIDVDTHIIDVSAKNQLIFLYDISRVILWPLKSS